MTFHNPRTSSLLLLFIFCIQIFSPSLAFADDFSSGSGTSLPILTTGSGTAVSASSSSSFSSQQPSQENLLHVVISEVMWMGSDKSTADEWLELAAFSNEGAANRLDLTGWTIRTMKSNQETVIARFANGTMVGSGEYLVVSNYSAKDSRLAMEPTLTATSMSLPNAKLLLRLRDASGALVDEVDDGIGDPFAGSNPSGGTKASMERIDLRLPGNISTNWKTATTSRGFDDGAPLLGTPGYANDSQSPREIYEQSSSSSNPVQPLPSIKINEVLPNPIGSDDNEWIELWNTGSTTANLSGMTLSVGNSSYRLKSSALSGAVIAPGSYLLIPKHAVGFTLANAGDSLSLLSGSQIIDSFVYPSLPEGVSEGRDDTGQLHSFCTPTPGMHNRSDPPSVQIAVQSGVTTGMDPVTLNLVAQAESGSSALMCHFDFGDGFTSDSCNPPSHTMRSIGTSSIQLQATDYCGNTVIRSIPVSVIPKPFSSKNSSKSFVTIPANERPMDCRPAAFTGMIVSEFVPNPSGDETTGEWVELQNVTGQSLPLCGWSLDDGTAGSRPYSLSSYQVPAGDYLLLPRKQTGIAFNNDADTVRLIAPRSEGGTGVVLSVAYQSAPENESYARDASGAWIWTKDPTPGLPNVFHTIKQSFLPSPVSISAALPNPSGDDTYDEWVALSNSDGIPHWLNGWYLQNNAGKKYLLTGTVLAKVQTKRVLLYKTGLALANAADTIRLVDADGIIRSVLSWQQAGAGQVIRPYQSTITRSIGRVLYIVDGDTIDVKLEGADTDIRVRLLGIDALEMNDQDPHTSAYSLKAKEYISALIENKKIELEIDSKKDKYGRTLAYVFLDGEDIGAQLIHQGLAYAYRAFPVGRLSEYVAYEDIARDAREGFWNDNDVAAKVNAKIVHEERYANAQASGMHISITPKLSLVTSGTTIRVAATVKDAPLFVSFNSGAYLPFSGSLIAQNDVVARFYAALRLPEDSGSIIRSTVLTHYVLVRKDSYPFSLFINEVYPSPLKGKPEWIELWNAGSDSVSLGGWQLLIGSGSQKWMIPPGTTVDPGGYIVFEKQQTGLQLRNAGTFIQLLNPLGQTVDRMTYPSIVSGKGYARDPKGMGFCQTETITKGFMNTCFTHVKSKKIVQKKTSKSGLKSKSKSIKIISNNVLKDIISQNTQKDLLHGLHAQVMSGSVVLQSSSDTQSSLDVLLSIGVSVFAIAGWMLFRKRVL